MARARPDHLRHAARRLPGAAPPYHQMLPGRDGPLWHPGNEEVCVTPPLCLIVNPAAGNGRARSILPAVTSALAAAGAEHRVVTSASLAHARELAADAAGRGEVIVAVG